MPSIDLRKITTHVIGSARSIKKGDIDELLGRGNELFKIVKSTKVLEKLWDGISSLFGLVRDFSSNKYRNVAFWDVALAVASLVYVISPLDFLPDILPLIGFVDDAALITWALSKLKTTLDEYAEWKAGT